jgi:hypothetical protein
MIRCRYNPVVCAVLAAASCLLAACATTRVFPELEARRSRIARIAVLPPATSFRQITFQGDNPRLTAEENAARTAVPDMIAVKLREHDVTVSDEAPPEGSDLAFQVAELEAVFDQAIGDLFGARVQPATQAHRSLGSQAARVAGPLKADALVLARVEGFSKSGGEIVKDFAKSLAVGVATLGMLVPVAPTSGSAIVVALVDGDTGDVLWSNMAHSTNGGIAASNLQALVNAALGGLPSGPFGGHEVASFTPAR